MSLYKHLLFYVNKPLNFILYIQFPLNPRLTKHKIVYI